MSTLDDLNAGPGGMAGFVSALTRRMRPVSRRDVKRDLIIGRAVDQPDGQAALAKAQAAVLAVRAGLVEPRS